MSRGRKDTEADGASETLASDVSLDLTLDAELEHDPDQTSIIEAARYYQGAMLGRGGMGEVVAAFDTQIGRDVAIKRMRDDTPTASTRRFMREARIQARLDHPAVVPVYELTTDRLGNPFFVMKRLSGITLGEILRRTNDGDTAIAARFPRPRLLRVFVDVCLAIEFAHSRSVIHRDLKPDNVMLGDFGEVYVLDWGVARVVDQPDLSYDASTIQTMETQGGLILGTPGYMPPEQVDDASAVDGRADVFALGAILFEILSGVPLLPGGTTGLTALYAGYDARPTIRASRASRPIQREVPPELDAVCVSATEFHLEHRTPSARVLAEQIESFLDGDRDSAVRERLVAANLELARALAHDETELARRNAFQAAGRALALDPTGDEAAALVGRLMVEPAGRTPPEVIEELAESDATTMRASVRREVVIAALYPLGFAPLAGVPWQLAAACAAWAIVLVAGVVVARAPSRGKVTAWIAANAAALGVLGWLGAPGLATAAIAVVIVMARAFHPRGDRLVLHAAMIAGAVVVPWVLELAGGSLGAAQALLTGGVVAALAVGAYVGRAAARAQREARRRIQLHAWQMRQLVGARRPPPPAN